MCHKWSLVEMSNISSHSGLFSPCQVAKSVLPITLLDSTVLNMTLFKVTFEKKDGNSLMSRLLMVLKNTVLSSDFILKVLDFDQD